MLPPAAARSAICCIAPKIALQSLTNVRTGSDLTEQHGEAPLGALADVLAQCITLPEQVMVELHGETDVAERARKVLSAERRFPAPQR